MYQVLLEKEKEALLELKEELLKNYKLLWMKLIGSKARGDYDKESDIDIVIVLEHLDWEVEKKIYEICFYLSLKYDILISPILYSQEDINNPLTQISPFFKMVKAEGILI